MKVKNIILMTATFAIILLMIVGMFSGCQKAAGITRAYQSVSGTNMDSQSLVQLSNYQLSWDNNAKSVLYYSLEKQKIWSDILYDLFSQGNKGAQANSPICITVANTKTLKWETVFSYSAMEENGNVLTKKIDGGIRVTYFFEKYRIAIPVEYVMREDCLAVTVDSSMILEDGVNYKLISVVITPNLCSVKNDAENGALFVPAGNGAIMYTKETSQGTRKYSGEIYGTDVARKYTSDLQNDETIRLPVFASYGNSSGMMGIVEDSAGATVINAQAGDSGLGYSNIGAEFYVRGYDTFNYNYYGKEKVNAKRISNEMSGQKVTVAYYPLFDEDANYNGTAKKYRDYLIKNNILEKSDVKASAYCVTLLGGTNISKSILGIPRKETVALTTFSQAEKILSDLKKKTGILPAVRMLGFGDNGLNSGKIDGGKKYPSFYGSEKELKSLLAYSKSTQMFFDSDIVTFTKRGCGFSKSSDVARTAISYKAEQFPVSPIRLIQEGNGHYILSRKNLPKAADIAIKKAKSYGINAISFSSLGSTAYSDFSDKQYYNKNEIEKDTASIFKMANDSEYMTAVSQANGYAVCAADVVFDTPDNNGNYDAFDMDIPFYQMVFHGYKNMYSAGVNLNESVDESVVKAIAYGMGIGFTISAIYQDESDDLDIYKLYATVYEDNSNSIVKAVKNSNYTKVYAAVANAQFIKYEMSSNGVCKSEYSNGITIYTNHTNDEIQTSVGKIEPYGFFIHQEGKNVETE